MNLYLMRHANAGVPRESAKLDAKRGLIAEGKEQCMLMGRLLGALKVQPDVIVSSPLKRALQTAQFVGNELGYEGKVEISPALDLSATYADFQKLIDKYADRQDVFFVGHNPNLVPVSRPPDYRQWRSGRAHAQSFGCAHRYGQAPAAAAVAHRSAHGALDLRQRGEKFALEDLAEVIRFFPQRPQLQFRTGASRFQLPDRRAWDTPSPLTFSTSLARSWLSATASRSSTTARSTLLMLVRRNIAQCAIIRLRTALAQVTRDCRNNGALHLRVSIHLRHRHDVLRVPVMPLVIDELAGIAQNSRGGQHSSHTPAADDAAASRSRNSCTAWARTGSACRISTP